MTEIYIDPEQARAYIARQHKDELELPRDYDFDRISSHMETSIVFAALSNTTVNLRVLYGALYAKSPGFIGERHGYTRAQNRQFGHRQVEYAIKEATLKDPEQLRDDPIEALQSQLANEWKLDKSPVSVYAVDSNGDVALVYVMGGYVTPEDGSAWDNVQKGIKSGINAEFHVSDLSISVGTIFRPFRPEFRNQNMPE